MQFEIFLPVKELIPWPKQGIILVGGFKKDIPDCYAAFLLPFSPLLIFLSFISEESPGFLSLF